MLRKLFKVYKSIITFFKLKVKYKKESVKSIDQNPICSRYF